MVRSGRKRAVGRPREFDEDDALEAALDVFWSKGYEATSLAELCEATGMHKGSLYQAFGDKHSLFMRALKHYADQEFRKTAAVAFDHDSPLDSIRAVVRCVCDDALTGKGCLMINSMVELAPHDPAVREAVAEEGARRLRVLTDLVSRAREAGEIRAELEPDLLAMQLMIAFAGSAALDKGPIAGDQVVPVIEAMIDQWT